MFVRQVPIEDLIYFLQDENNFNTKEKIPELIIKHYKFLTGLNITTDENLILPNWCFCDHGFIKNNNYPTINGLLVYTNNIFGILIEDRVLFREGKKYKTRPFEPSEWEQWGVMTRFYDYRKQGYEGHQNYLFGSRKLQIGDVGSDVMQLQILLDSRIITGEFNKETEDEIVTLQTILDELPTNGIFDPKQESIMNYLIRKNNEYKG